MLEEECCKPSIVRIGSSSHFPVQKGICLPLPTTHLAPEKRVGRTALIPGQTEDRLYLGLRKSVHGDLESIPEKVSPRRILKERIPAKKEGEGRSAFKLSHRNRRKDQVLSLV